MATFQIKDFNSISASLINLMSSTQQKVTDFNIGSVVRTMLEACASELDELYQQIFNGILQAIPVSVYNTFQFGALPAVAGSTLITVSITAQTTTQFVPAGTTFTPNTTSNIYASTADFTFAVGQTSGQIPVAATTTGASTNLGAGATFSMSSPPAGFIGATNANAIINGADPETAAAQLIRFQQFISTLQRGTPPAVQYGASTAQILDSSGNLIEQVATALVVEPYLTNNSLPISSYYCYIHNGVGGTSTNLVSLAQQIVNGYTNSSGVLVPGYKAAGTICTVAAATEQTRSVTATLTAAPGYTKSTLVTQATTLLSAYLLSIPVGGSALFALIESLVMAIPGVANFVISAPTSDTAATASNYKIMPGAITIS